VSNFVSTISCTYGYVFKIVSNSHSLKDVSAALFRFIRTDILDILQSLPLATLLAHTQALIDKYLLPSVDLHDEAKCNWDEIETNRCDFELYNAKAAHLRGCVGDERAQRRLIADLVSFCNYYFVSTQSCRVLHVTAGHPTTD
jgi:hypothetical protein